MTWFHFTIDGPLRSYRKSTIPVRGRRIRINDPAYTAFKNTVVVLAMEAGWRPKEGARPRLSVAVNWTKRARKDWSNVYKAVEDALFKQDRNVMPGSRNAVHFDQGKEYAEVWIHQ